MNTQPRQLTCYIKKTRSDPDMWEAFCVELDIPAVGDTYEEVAAMMYQAVDNYIDYVYERQPDDEQRLLYRPMPKADVWKLQFEERFLQRLPFSKRQVRKLLPQRRERDSDTAGSALHRVVPGLQEVPQRRRV